jgi:hypothetical protein
MSSLQQSLESRQLADVAPTVVILAKTPAAGIEVLTSTEEQWAIPWSNFVGARLFRSPASDRIVVSFTEHEIVIEGLRLGSLLKEIAACRIEYLTQHPSDCRFQPPNKVPHVRSVSVRLLNAPP